MSSLSGAQYEAELPAQKPGACCEIDLLKRAQGGDRAAFGQVVVRYQDRLFNAILRLVGDHEEARELTQEAFTRALEKLDGFRGDANPYTWLFRIGLNLAISQLRKVRRHRVFSLDGAGNDGDGRVGADGQASGLIDRMESQRQLRPEAELERKEQREQVLAALGRLDADQRALLVMRDVEGFDYQQMANLLEMPLGTLKSRLFRARVALKDELEQYMTR